MKNIILKIKLLVIVAFAVLTANAQLPTAYQCVIMNDSLVAANVYEFDIYLKNTSTNTSSTPFVLSQFQAGFSLSAAFRNSGTINVSVVSGSSGLLAGQIPTPTNSGSGRAFWELTDPNYIRITPKILANGTVISGTGFGTRVARFRLTNTNNFSGTPNLAWNFSAANQAYPTKIFAYNAATSQQIDITNQSAHLNQSVVVSRFSYIAKMVQDTFISDSIYEFKVYIKNTNPNINNFPIIMSQFQGGFSVSNNFRNGGNVTVFISSSELTTSGQTPVAVNSGSGRTYWELVSPNYIRLTPKSPTGGYANGKVLATTGDGTLIATIRLVNNKKFVGVPSINWNFSTSNQAYPTKIFAYNSASQLQSDITNQSSHLNQLSNSPATIKFDLSVLLQGIFTSNRTMTPALFNSAVSNYTENDADLISVDFVNSLTNEVELTLSPTLSITGLTSMTLPRTMYNNQYYVVVKHRNSIETWSANPVHMNAASKSYDFTISAESAYGDNQVMVEDDVFAIYGGDINQDGFVDGNDFIDVDNDNTNFASGYLVTDANGDGFVDGNDFIMIDNNNTLFIGVTKP
jgi:hypothetical protein